MLSVLVFTDDGGFQVNAEREFRGESETENIFAVSFP